MAWLGATLATIVRLDLPADPAAEAAYVLHPAADWTQWTDDARLLGVVTEATAFVEAALDTEGLSAVRLMHRDMSLRNILVGPDGPLLLDFDSAGPEVPWWEFVSQTFHATTDPRLVRVAVRAFGGTGPTGASAFAGMVRGLLESTAYELWLAEGHRPVSPARRAAAVQTVRRAADGIAEVLRHAPERAGWLTSARR
jgi:aminoglycoside phosphotransferase (APT) family kinase protein